MSRENDALNSDDFRTFHFGGPFFQLGEPAVHRTRTLQHRTDPMHPARQLYWWSFPQRCMAGNGSLQTELDGVVREIPFFPGKSRLVKYYLGGGRRWICFFFGVSSSPMMPNPPFISGENNLCIGLIL